MKLKPYKLDVPWSNLNDIPSILNWLTPQLHDNHITGDTVRFNSTAEQFTVELDLPGVAREDINLEIYGQKVFITAKRTIISNGGVKEETINRSFGIDNDADLETITAKQNNGVLTVSAKRKSSSKHSTRRINID